MQVYHTPCWPSCLLYPYLTYTVSALLATMRRAIHNTMIDNALAKPTTSLPMQGHAPSLLGDTLPASYPAKPTSITHGDITLRVTGLAWELDSALDDTVHACGFDSLTVNDSVTLDSIDALRELAPCVHVGRILCMLDIQSQLDSDQWISDCRRLKHWLGRQC